MRKKYLLLICLINMQMFLQAQLLYKEPPEEQLFKDTHIIFFNYENRSEEYSKSINDFIDTLPINACPDKKKGKAIVEIDFQDSFKKDQVSLELNGCSIFKNIILTSDDVLGFSYLSVYIHKKEKDSILVRIKHYDNYSDNLIRCDLNNCDELRFEVSINGEVNLVELNLNNGKYIGFTKIKPNNVYVIQSKYTFGYD